MIFYDTLWYFNVMKDNEDTLMHSNPQPPYTVIHAPWSRGRLSPNYSKFPTNNIKKEQKSSSEL